MLEVYAYAKCSTCRKALKWLDAEGIDYKLIDIVDSPPSLAKLKRVQRQAGLPVAKLFNTSGQSYRNGNYKAKLDKMTDAEALAALAQDGKLIKRPLVVSEDAALVGFREEEYQSRLGRAR